MSVSVFKKLKGGPELQKLLDTLPVRLERNILRAGLRAGATIVRDAARNNINNDTGALAKSVRVSTRAKGGVVSATVKAGNAAAPYAGMVEFGTSPHLLNKGANQKSKVLNIAGKLISGKIEHPGAKPAPFLRPAIDQNQAEVIQAVGNRIRDRLKKEGLSEPSVGLGLDE